VQRGLAPARIITFSSGGLEAGDRALLTYASADGEIGTRLFRVGALLDRDVQALFVADGPEPICPRSVPVPRPPAAVP